MASITRCRTSYYEQEVPRKLEDFNDWEFSSGGTTGQDFKIFARLFKKCMKDSLPSRANLVKFHSGHYDLSGFVQRDDKFVYFSISDVRHFSRAWRDDILIRTAKSDQDYTGGGNNYTSLEDFGEKVNRLLARG